MNNQIPEKTNDNGVDKQVSKTVRTVRRLSWYRIISMIVRMALAVWVTLEVYNDSLSIMTRTVWLVLISIFEAECIMKLIKNLLIRFTNGREFQEAVKAVEEMNDAIK